MHVSIVHTDVRVDPELVVDVVAAVDGRSLRVNLERDVIVRLLGSDLSDQQKLFQTLQKRLGAIRIAVEAYVLARGFPLDSYVVLSWDDFSALAEDLQ